MPDPMMLVDCCETRRVSSLVGRPHPYLDQSTTAVSLNFTGLHAGANTRPLTALAWLWRPISSMEEMGWDWLGMGWGLLCSRRTFHTHEPCSGAASLTFRHVQGDPLALILTA